MHIFIVQSLIFRSMRYIKIDIIIVLNKTAEDAICCTLYQTFCITKVQRQVYKTVIKPTYYGVVLSGQKDENRLHVAEMRMLRWIRGKTRKDHVRNQVVQEDANQRIQDVNIHEIEKIKYEETFANKHELLPYSVRTINNNKVSRITYLRKTHAF